MDNLKLKTMADMSSHHMSKMVEELPNTKLSELTEVFKIKVGIRYKKLKKRVAAEVLKREL